MAKATSTVAAPRDLSNAIAITGIGESEYSEGGGNQAESLIFDACERAIDDAGLTPGDIDGIVTESKMTPGTVAPGDLNETLGLDLQFSTAIGRVGGGTVASPIVAAQAIENGLAEHVICYFGVDWASEREQKGGYEGGPYSYHTQQPLKANIEVPFGWVNQPVYLASFARRHMHTFGTTREQLGEIAVQTRANAVENDNATKREPLTLEDYFDSPIIADPFRILDCCLISDGAAAFVMSSTSAANRGPNTPVSVKGVGYAPSGYAPSTFMTQHEPYTSLPAAESGPRAFAMAGVTPDDIDFAELYDCFTITPLLQLEDLGFCEKGAGGRFVQERGITVDNGDLPVNTHGGLLSQAYILGINHLIEAVHQLRGTADNQVADAELGLVGGWGGNDHATLILERQA